MATIKLKKPDTTAADPRSLPRAPLRGNALKARPTLAQAQVQRAEREALYQEQLRQRFGDRPPAAFQRRGEPERPPRGQQPRQAPQPPTSQMRRAPQQDRWQPQAPDPRQARRPELRQQPAPAARPRRDPLPPATVNRNAVFDQRVDQRVDPRIDPRVRREVPAGRPTRGDPPSSNTGPGGPNGPNTAFGQRPPHPGAPPRDDPRRGPALPLPQQRRRRDHDDDDDREPAAHALGSMRLSKRMSELGIASRREADEWIAKGYVRVDDQIVSELGSRVLPHQRVTIDAKAKFQQAQRVTVLVNKPVGYVSGQAEDGYEPAVVLVTPENQWREDRSGTRFLREHLKSLVPAGRLDIDSVGLLVLTQDGRVAKTLIGEDSAIEKEYLVRVATASGTRLTDNSLALLRHGLEIDGEALLPAQVEWVNDDQLRFVLKEGKKRQIRRMCEAVGLQVLGLKRVRIGSVMLGDLPAGQWRYLRGDEVFG